MTTTRCYCCKYRSTERVSVNKFDCVQLGILRNQFGKKRYYLALGMGPNVGPKWRAAAIFFPSHDKNVSSGGILSARRCLRTRIFFLYDLKCWDRVQRQLIYSPNKVTHNILVKRQVQISVAVTCVLCISYVIEYKE